MDIIQKKLRNNLQTTFINAPGSTSASIQIWFRAGSALESTDERGIAHFLEHMFFKGTTKRPAASIALEVETFGGEINAFTSFDYTCYYINAPTNKIKQSIDILLDMVSNPNFNLEDIPPERDVVFEEYRRSIDNPSQYNFFRLQKDCFTKAYSHPILGTPKNIKNFSKSQLNSFRNKFYSTSNALLVVAGDLKKPHELESLVSQFKLPLGEPSIFSTFRLKQKATLNLHFKDVTQVALTLNIQAAKNYISKESAAQELALNCLSFGDISPLYKSLISESSLATACSGSTMFFNSGGLHTLKIVFPINSSQEVLNKFLTCIANIFEVGFTKKQVERIRNQYMASKAYEKETIESYSFSIGHSFAQNGDIYCEDKFLDEIRKLTLSDINKALKSIFSICSHIQLQLPVNTSKEEVSKIEKSTQSFQTSLFKLATRKSKQLKSELYTSSIDPNLKVAQIAKGVKFLHRQNTISPTFAFHTYIKGGQAHEVEENSGIFNLLSRLITHGHSKKTYEKLKLDFEMKSAYINGYSGKNAFGITMNGLSECFDSLVEDYFLCLTSPKIPQQYLKLEKELLNRQFEMQKEDPVKQCFQKVNSLVFNSHPYAMDATGTSKSIKSINRKKILDIHKNYIENSEIVFTYCGVESFEDTYKKITPFLKSFTKRGALDYRKNKVHPVFGERVNLSFKREQTHIFIGAPSYKNGLKEDLYLKMLTTLLSGQSSDLFVEVRDKLGLCYSVQPIHYSALEAGYWGIYIGAGKEKASDAVEAILKILDKIQSKGISKSDFRRIQKMIEGSNLLALQTNDDYANYYSIPLLHGLGVDFQHKALERIKNFDHKDFNGFLKTFLKQNWNIVSAGPSMS